MKDKRERLILVCKHCGKIFEKPYWQVREAVNKNMEVGFCSRECFTQYRSDKSWEIIKDLKDKDVKAFIKKYHFWIVKMLKEKNSRYNEEIYSNIMFELPRCIARFKENKFEHKAILTYLAKIVSTKTIEYNKKNKNVKYYSKQMKYILN